MDEAIAEHKLAQKYDPFNPLHTAWLGTLYYYNGQYEEAIEAAIESLDMQQDYAAGYYVLGMAYLYAGQDEKVIAVPSHALTKRYDDVLNATDLPEITLQQIEHFFEHYKDLEPGKWVKISGWQGADDAKRLIVEAIERAKG